MSRVFSAHAVSVDGYISGALPTATRSSDAVSGDAPMLFDWVFGRGYGEPGVRRIQAVSVLLGAGRSFFHDARRGSWK